MQISWDLDFREIRLDLFNKCYFLLKQKVLILQDLDTYFSPTGMFLRNFVRKFGMHGLKSVCTRGGIQWSKPAVFACRQVSVY